MTKKGACSFYFLKEAESGDAKIGNDNREKKNKGNRAGGLDARPVKNRGGIHVIGHNWTTLCSKENKDLFNIYLNELYNQDKIAILMLNEVGKIYNGNILDKPLRDKYAIMGSGTRTSLVYDRRLKVNMIMDKMNDTHNQIAVVTNTDKKRLILYNVYVAPGDTHGASLDAAKIRLRAILDRYKDAKVVVYGDFNIKRDKIKKDFLDYFNDKKLLSHVDTIANSFTRCRKVSGSVQYSYLDYIFTYGINCSGLKVCKPIEKSDHMTLKLDIPYSELGDIIEKRNLNFDFNGPKNDALVISKKLIDIFSRSGKACELIALNAEMRKKYGPRCKKVKYAIRF